MLGRAQSGEMSARSCCTYRWSRPARRICGLHAILAVQEAESKGWFDEEHEAPEVIEASWESPKFDGQLMNKFLSDTNTASMFHLNDREAA